MACVQNIPPINADSEMEEGEIVDDLSDISSEEEFLLRQRLEVLENYNNVLERKKAKRSSNGPGKKHKKEDALSQDLSEISASELEDYCPPHKNIKVQKHPKTHHRQKRKKVDVNVNEVIKNKDHKKRTSRPKRKTEAVKIISESSEESDDEYRNRRRRLAEAVDVHKIKNDKTSLSERLQKMFFGVNPELMKLGRTEVNTKIKASHKTEMPPNCSPISSQTTDDHILCSDIQDATKEIKTPFDIIDICTDEDSKTGEMLVSVDVVDSVNKGIEQKNVIQDIVDRAKESDIQNIVDRAKESDIQNIVDSANGSDKDSDEDLELLRQHALKTKSNKTGKIIPEDNKILSEDEDSDTAELRVICLKSAILKKAIEMKQKQKLQKKISQSSDLEDDAFDHVMMADEMNLDNNTDIESVDMDMGSDADEKVKENGDCAKDTASEKIEKNIPVLMVSKEDELDEDEDLLRAKLLTSLSKNLPNLVTPNIIKSIDSVKTTPSIVPKQPQASVVVPEEKRFIINVDSDSEGEHEATKNLTKMHMKLSEQRDFQQKLDMFLKSTRMEVEKTKLPDVVQQQVTPNKNEKFVAKAVKNLPKSEQIEYRNLVKRMAELEKIKQARQSTINLANKVTVPVKDTLKPRNVTFDTSNLPTINNLEEKIKNSRKIIAEESAKMLKLKDEGNKLSQKFKIVATELRNIKTAIALNKKQQRSAQNSLTKIRLHHQMLLKSSPTSTHSKPNAIIHQNHVTPRLQKENNPKDHHPIALKEIPKGSYKNFAMLKAIKVGVTNDLKQQKPENKSKPLVIQHPRLSVEVDITNNKKVVTIPCKDGDGDKIGENISTEDLLENKRLSSNPVVEKGGGMDVTVASAQKRRRDSDDYRSPLDAFGNTTWQADPNAILCPFEVCGDCKDTDCKYLHTYTHSK